MTVWRRHSADSQRKPEFDGRAAAEALRRGLTPTARPLRRCAANYQIPKKLVRFESIQETNVKPIMWARIPTIVTLVSLHSMPCAGAETTSSKWAKLDDTKLSLTISAQPPGEEPVQVMAKVLFTKQFAVSAVQDPDTATGIRWEHALLFDLDRMAWYDAAQQRWVDLKSGQAWEKATLERTKRSLALSSDEQTRAFIQAITDPQFDVQKEDDGTIVISNSHLTYSIIPAQKISPELLERFLAYDVLNAYNKGHRREKVTSNASSCRRRHFGATQNPPLENDC